MRDEEQRQRGKGGWVVEIRGVRRYTSRKYLVDVEKFAGFPARLLITEDGREGGRGRAQDEEVVSADVA
jgi:hypothetical protein